ncbi:hypothetical protein CPJCM30710_29030 [Clostridium polyendosporum]|uniref:Two component regulator three Y domain-containing protein n=1 Tax=Clostridium polyendosporum TaxID=69208 RepID=A0A919S176_9CLOT|nr:triple tyrosine motif-containing protein [Clostridium polyendosporum]GIM30237.1 hypothetical protein CPJCM30710_29030 [Clostridium polyendosporum]
MNNCKNLFKIFVLTFILFFVYDKSAMAADVSIKPSSLYGIEGQAYDISINVSNVSNLYGASLEWTYNKSLVSIENYSIGLFPDNKIYKIQKNDTSTGKLDLAITMLGQSNSLNITNESTLFKIRIKTLGKGQLDFNFLNNFKIKLADSSANAINFNYKNLSFPLYEKVFIQSITTDKPTPQGIGQDVRLKANVAGGKDILYKFTIFDGKTWKVVQDYSASDTYLWKPASVGSYRLWVDVKDKSSPNRVDSFREINYTIKDFEFYSITTDKPSPQTLGNKIKVTANTSGGQDWLYRFTIFDGYTWKMVQDYSENNIYYFSPAKEGNYRIWVDVKNRYSNNAVDKFREINYTIKNFDFSSITTDKPSAQTVGNKIKVTANTSGGSDLLYRFTIFDGYTWKTVQSYSANNVYYFTPTKAGDYRIWVDVKNRYSNNTVDKFREISYKIINNFDFYSITTDKPSPQTVGNKIKVTANTSGGPDLLYRFTIFDGYTWNIVQSYSANNIYYFTPAKAGNYRIWVDVKNRYSGNGVDKFREIYYKVN